jgi:hypothetical protein
MRALASFVPALVAGAALVACTDARSSAGADAAAGTGSGNAGTTGGAGTTGSGGGAGAGGGAASTARVFETFSAIGPPMPLPSPCDAGGACPEGRICFRLAAELAVCDVPEAPVQTACSFTTDECDCAGRTCAAGRVCVTVQESTHFYNQCLEPACASPSDCAGGTVCTPTSLITKIPGRCFTPVCRSDADCAGGVDGRCALLVEFNGGPSLEMVGCVFAGLPADATACAPDQATRVRVRDSALPYHTCAGR